MPFLFAKYQVTFLAVTVIDTRAMNDVYCILKLDVIVTI
jgi:hypothetical protein